MILTLILYLFYIRKVFFEGTSKSLTAFFTVLGLELLSCKLVANPAAVANVL
jgi:hypothetical protein